MKSGALNPDELASSKLDIPKILSILSIALATLNAFGLSDSIKRICVDIGIGGSNVIAVFARPILIILTIAFAIPKVGRSLRFPVLLFAYLLYVTFSMAWSADVSATLGSLQMLWAVTISYGMAASTIGGNEAIRVVYKTLIVSIAFGLVFYLLGANWAAVRGTYDTNIIGRDPLGGVFGWNVIAGVASAICFYIHICEMGSNWNVKNISICMLLISFTLLSASGTGLLLLFLSIPVRLLSIMLRRMPPAIGLAAVGGLPLLFLAVLEQGGLGAVRSGAILSGREVVWRIGIENWLQRPIWGWGFQSLLGNGALAGSVGGLWLPRHFHNDALQILAETGIVGLTLFVVALVAEALRLLKLRGAGESYGLLAAGLLSLSAANAMLNQSFGFFGAGWFLLVLVSFGAFRSADGIAQKRVGRVK